MSSSRVAKTCTGSPVRFTECLISTHTIVRLALCFVALVASLQAFDEEHLKNLREGPEHWNDWRREQGDAFRPELRDANLSGMSLNGVNLRGANLEDAKLQKASLDGADLREATLLDVDLRGASLTEAKLGNAHVTGDLRCTDLARAKLRDAILDVRLNHANLSDADLRGARLVDSDLRDADLPRADLRGADLRIARLRDAVLADADLRGADLFRADLTNADLTEARLSGADFAYASLHGVYYEPRSNPAADRIVTAEGLYEIRFERPQSLTLLKTSFASAGFSSEARRINAMLRRKTDSFVERVLFDWTCAYGTDWLRPLRLIVYCWLIFSFVYLLHLFGLWSGSTRGIYLVVRRTKSMGQDFFRRRKGGYVRPSRSHFNYWKTPCRHPAMRLLCFAWLFSAMSAFNIGFREFNFARWIRLLPARPFETEARGWIRTVSGVQSLLSVYLIALALLSYFGAPFEK